MLNTTRSLRERAQWNRLRANQLRQTALRLVAQIDGTWRSLRRVVESWRIIAGGQDVFESSLTFYVEEREDACVIHVSGEIDLSGVPQLHAVLHGAAGKGRLIVLSLRDVDYLDAAAIRVLERATIDLKGAGARLVVVEPSPLISKIFEIVQLRVEVVPTLHAAALNSAALH